MTSWITLNDQGQGQVYSRRDNSYGNTHHSSTTEVHYPSTDTHQPSAGHIKYMQAKFSFHQDMD